MVQRKKAKATTRAKAKAPVKKGRKIKGRSLKKVRGGLLGSAGAVEWRQKENLFDA